MRVEDLNDIPTKRILLEERIVSDDNSYSFFMGQLPEWLTFTLFVVFSAFLFLRVFFNRTPGNIFPSTRYLHSIDLDNEIVDINTNLLLSGIQNTHQELLIKGSIIKNRQCDFKTLNASYLAHITLMNEIKDIEQVNVSYQPIVFHFLPGLLVSSEKTLVSLDLSKCFSRARVNFVIKMDFSCVSSIKYEWMYRSDFLTQLKNPDFSIPLCFSFYISFVTLINLIGTRITFHDVLSIMISTILMICSINQNQESKDRILLSLLSVFTKYCISQRIYDSKIGLFIYFLISFLSEAYVFSRTTSFERNWAIELVLPVLNITYVVLCVVLITLLIQNSDTDFRYGFVASVFCIISIFCNFSANSNKSSLLYSENPVLWLDKWRTVYQLFSIFFLILFQKENKDDYESINKRRRNSEVLSQNIEDNIGSSSLLED